MQHLIGIKSLSDMKKYRLNPEICKHDLLISIFKY